MPSKLQTYMQMADEAQRQITGSYRGWTGFLTTAARLYKYPYAEQVMIHAQRPDATACAEYDFWNEKMGRYGFVFCQVKKSLINTYPSSIVSERQKPCFIQNSCAAICSIFTGAEILQAENSLCKYSIQSFTAFDPYPFL